MFKIWTLRLKISALRLIIESYTKDFFNWQIMSVGALDSVMDTQVAQLNLLLYQIYRPYFNGKTQNFMVRLWDCSEFLSLEVSFLTFWTVIYGKLETFRKIVTFLEIDFWTCDCCEIDF